MKIPFLFNKAKVVRCSSDGKVGNDFIIALLDFSLAHTELMSFRAALKVQEVSQRSTDLAAVSEEIAASAEEVGASTQEISAGMQELQTGSMENIKRIDRLGKLSINVNETMNSMVANAKELAEKTKKIENINQNVANIADQTNLLALNAAIEAARAGEHGRGFSVVADEVRKLATQTKDAVTEVKNISNEMIDKTTVTNNAVNIVKGAFEEYIIEANQVSETIRESMGRLQETTSATDNIANATQQQASATENLANLAEGMASDSDFGESIRDEAAHLSQIIRPVLQVNEREDINSILAARLVDHANFLRNTINNAGKGGRATTHHECAFGKWYDANTSKYHEVAEYKIIDDPHRRVHEAADMLLKSCTVENIEKFIKASSEILQGFIKLPDALKNFDDK